MKHQPRPFSRRIVRTVISKELLEYKKDGRLLLAAVPLFLTLLCAIVVGALHYHLVHQAQITLQTQERVRWLQKGKLNYHVAAHFGILVPKPFIPFVAYDYGINRYVGMYTLMEAHRENLFQGKEADQGLPVRRVSELTVAVVLQVLVPLVIVVLGFDLIAGERERGTWRQTLSQGVEPRDLLIGKVIAFAIPIGIAVTAPTLIGGMLLLIRASFDFDAVERLTALFVFYLMFAVIVCAITVSVSTFTRTSRRALTILLLFWFFNSLLGPRVAALVAAKIAPELSAVAFQIKMDTELDVASRHAHDKNEQHIAQYHVDSQANLPERIKALDINDYNTESKKITDAVFESLYSTQLRQERITELAGVLAPLLSVQGLSMGISASDLASHFDFSRASSTYRFKLEQILNEEGSHQHSDADVSGPDLWARVPPFTYSTPSLWWALRNHLSALLGLSVWLILSGLLVSASVKKAGSSEAL